MVDKSPASPSPFGAGFLMFCSPDKPSPPGARSLRVRLLALQHSRRDMTPHPPLASIPLKRKPLARSTRAPRAPPIVGWFSRLPSLAYAAGSVALAICHRALVAARAPLAVLGEEATSVVIGSPPLEMCQQLRSLLGCGPASTGQRCYGVTNRQIQPFNKRRVEPSRMAQIL